jgi:non-homologous end joining protein Ku
VPQDAEWRILAEEAAQENNPNKLIEIIEALTRALDQQQHKKKAVSASHRAQPKGGVSLS